MSISPSPCPGSRWYGGTHPARQRSSPPVHAVPVDLSSDDLAAQLPQSLPQSLPTLKAVWTVLPAHQRSSPPVHITLTPCNPWGEPDLHPACQLISPSPSPLRDLSRRPTPSLTALLPQSRQTPRQRPQRRNPCAHPSTPAPVPLSTPKSKRKLPQSLHTQSVRRQIREQRLSLSRS